MNKEENILYGGMLSDIDIRSFWGKGIAIFSSEPGGIAFDLKEQLQFGSIDLRARHACNTIKLSKNEAYIASKYIEHKEQNHAIYHALKQASIDAFCRKASI